MTAFVLTFLASCCLLGWIRAWRPWGDAFRQAEVIVVARIVPNTVRLLDVTCCVPEHAAVLRVTEVLKGSVTSPEIAVVIHYGLTPVVGGYLNERGTTIDAGHSREGVIEVYDTSNGNVEPFVTDAREDHLWLLSRHPEYHFYGGTLPEHAHQLGIVEPDEVVPVDKPGLDRLQHSGDPELIAMVGRILAQMDRGAPSNNESSVEGEP